MISVPSPQPAVQTSAVSNSLALLPGSYCDRLHPWCIVRRLPNMQNAIVGRFRKHNDAEEHLKTLRRLAPVDYVIVFEGI